VVEDFLDRWPGTLVVVSHDRYFLERVTDSIWALMGDGQISMLPNGVEQYLAHRREGANVRPQPTGPSAPQQAVGDEGKAKAKVGGAEERAARKTVARIDKQLKRIETREAQLTEEMALADPEHLQSLSAELQSLSKEKAELEAEWLEAATLLE
jgi:ATP-binding cassette subfamily F protein uup